MSTVKNGILAAVLVFCTIVMGAVGIILVLTQNNTTTDYQVFVFNARTQGYIYRGESVKNNADNPIITVPSLGPSGRPITVIGANAFRNFRNLDTVNLPSSLVEIHDGAFRNSSITSIIIPNSVNMIGHSAFRDCNLLDSVTLPNSLIEISANTFQGCVALESIIIPPNVRTIGARAFSGCTALRTIIIRRTIDVITITNTTFENCPSIDEIFVPNNTVQGMYMTHAATSPMWAWAMNPVNLFWVGVG